MADVSDLPVHIRVLGRLWILPRVPSGVRVLGVSLTSAPDALAVSIDGGPRTWAKR